MLAPEYAKAAKMLTDLKSEIKLAKVDATVETELAESHNIRGYPTIKFFRKGSAIEYSGGRQAEGIVNWVQKKSGPAVKELSTVEEVKELLEQNKVAVVGFFKVFFSIFFKFYWNKINKQHFTRTFWRTVRRGLSKNKKPISKFLDC